MRKMKTEFMAAWDGLRTNQYDRVLVLAATNRPGDLDEAVVRRMPRRLMVDLPDAANRAKILKVSFPSGWSRMALGSERLSYHRRALIPRNKLAEPQQERILVSGICMTI